VWFGTNATGDIERIFFNSDIITIKVGVEQEVTFTATIYGENIENETVDLYSEEGFIKTLYRTNNGDSNERTYSGKILVSSNTRKSLGYFVKSDNAESRVVNLSFYAPLSQEEKNQVELLLSDVEDIKSKYSYNSQNISEEQLLKCIEEIILYLESCQNLVYDLTSIGIVVKFDFNYVMGLPLDKNDNKQSSNKYTSKLNFSSSATQSEASIITLQPAYNDLPTTVFDEAAKTIENANNKFKFEKNLDNEQVTVDELMALSDYRVIIIDGHGGNWSNIGIGYILALSEVATPEKIERYTESGDLGITVINNNNHFVVTEAFFDKYYSPGDFANTLFYWGTCHGGDLNVNICDIVLDKGKNEAVILSFRDTVISRYNRELVETIFKELSTGQTIENSVTTAKTKHGSFDPYISSDTYNDLSFWDKLWYNLGYIGNANPAELILSGDRNWSLDKEYYTYTAIAGIVTEQGTSAPLSGVLVQATKAGSTAIVASTTTNESGQYALTIDRNATYNVKFTKSGYDEQMRENISVAESVVGVAVTMVLSSEPPTFAIIAGTVVEQGTNALLSGVQVQATKTGSTTVVASATTNTSGQYSLTLNINETYNLKFTKSGYEEQTKVNVNLVDVTMALDDVLLVRENSYADYSKIYTSQDLDNVRNNLSGKYVLMNDIDLASWGNWVPLGTSDIPFTGVFNGNGYAIHNMKITTNWRYNGLFGYAKEAVISNTGIVDSTISFTSSSSYCYAGGIAGEVSSSLINNCYHTGVINVAVNSTVTAGSCYAGGIAGYSSFSTINACSNTGKVSANSDSRFFVGGIVGYNGSSFTSNCYNTGEISATTTSVWFPTVGAGGIVGYHGSGSGIVSSCYNIGIAETKPTCFGGIVGQNIGHIKDCYSLNNTSKAIWDNNTYATYSNVRSCDESQLKQQSTFVGFDFDTVWAIDPAINNGYPYLRGMQP